RCDGEANGGCQAACLLFWKDAWVKRVKNGPASERANDRHSAIHRSSTRSPVAWHGLSEATRAPKPDGETGERYRCQTTDLLKATTDVRRRDRWKPGLYLKDLTSRNVQLHEFIWYGLIAIFNNLMLTLSGRRYPHVCGLAGDKTPSTKLNLQPGELVQVRSKDEFTHTFNAHNKQRGLEVEV